MSWGTNTRISNLKNAIPLVPWFSHEDGKKRTWKTRLFTSSGSPESIKWKAFLKREYGPLLTDYDFSGNFRELLNCLKAPVWLQVKRSRKKKWHSTHELLRSFQDGWNTGHRSRGPHLSLKLSSTYHPICTQHTFNTISFNSCYSLQRVSWQSPEVRIPSNCKRPVSPPWRTPLCISKTICPKVFTQRFNI